MHDSGNTRHYQERQTSCLQGPPELNIYRYTVHNGRGERRLDVLVRRRDNGELTTSVFRKTTNTLQMLSYKSNQPQAHKRSCVKTSGETLQHTTTGHFFDLAETKIPNHANSWMADFSKYPCRKGFTLDGALRPPAF